VSLPAADSAAHRSLVPWTDTAQVEQDLLLRALAISIAGDPALGAGLAWRGGTCLHTLVLDHPRRYSEDLDYVQVDPGLSKGDIADAVRSIAAGLGMAVTKADLRGGRANVRVAHPSSVGGDIVIKVEVNTEEVAARHPLRSLPMRLRTRQFGQMHADVLTFSAAELIRSKFRALAQRRKGRDLSDVWLARHALARR
jgi:predicted nucleotidyltransferase component of viral defense system